MALCVHNFYTHHISFRGNIHPGSERCVLSLELTIGSQCFLLGSPLKMTKVAACKDVWPQIMSRVVFPQAIADGTLGGK